MNVRFAAYRDALGLPGELGPHCLRHTYVTHLIEDGFDVKEWTVELRSRPRPVAHSTSRMYQQTLALFCGYHIDAGTATAWAARAGGNWNHYAASRLSRDPAANGADHALS